MSKAKKIHKRKSSKEMSNWSIPLTSFNFKIFGVGIILLIAGFYIMTFKPWDSIFALVISPIILLISYIIIFPFGILKKQNNKE